MFQQFVEPSLGIVQWLFVVVLLLKRTIDRIAVSVDNEEEGDIAWIEKKRKWSPFGCAVKLGREIVPFIFRHFIHSFQPVFLVFINRHADKSYTLTAFLIIGDQFRNFCTSFWLTASQSPGYMRLSADASAI